VSYEEPGEYHIKIEAQGYKDGELFIKPLEKPEDLGGLLIEMHKLDSQTIKSEATRVTGRISLDGKPVKAGWISAWTKCNEPNPANVRILRGCPAPYGGRMWQRALLQADGAFILYPLSRGTWFFLVQTANRRNDVVGPIILGKGEGERALPIDLPALAAIRGKVVDLPERMLGRVFVVAFNDNIFRTEARVALDGTFELEGLPSGTYGLRAGHDDFGERRTAYEKLYDFNDFDSVADPWKGVTKITVGEGDVIENVVVDYTPAAE